MRGTAALGSMIGGLVIYVTMATCSAASDDRWRADDNGGATGAGGSAGAGGIAGAGGSLLDAMVDAIADALTDPVSEAGAEPEVKTAGCDVVVGQNRFAEALFPGRSVDALARAYAIGHLATPIEHYPAGYSNIQVALLIQPERVATPCGYGADILYDNVTFYLPPE